MGATLFANVLAGARSGPLGAAVADGGRIGAPPIEPGILSHRGS